MWPNRIDRLRIAFHAALAVLCIAGAASLHAQCGSDDSTNAVYIDVVGCTKLPDEFEVVIGGEAVPVTRSAGRMIWSGTTESPFLIKDGRITKVNLPGFRTACTTLAKPQNDGPCVARYRLQCEPMCLVRVKSVPEQTRATIDYVRQSGKAFDGCEKPAGTLSTPGSLAFGSSDELTISTTSIVGALMEGKLTFGMFQEKPEWTMIEIAAQSGGTGRSSVHTSFAATEVRKRTAENMVFVRQ